MLARYTFCALLYGDFPQLASRCLHSLFSLDIPAENIRVGANAIGAATSQMLETWLTQGRLLESGIYRSDINLHKYPMMRRMFYQPRIETPYLAWFDDDSYVANPALFSQSLQRFTEESSELAGSIYQIRLRPSQVEWIKAQPWHAGQPINTQARFVTGGFWLARASAIFQVDYPWPSLDHNGGDVMLGACAAQQRWRVLHRRCGVAINADEHGRESRATRRGFSQPPIGADFQAPAAAPPRQLPSLNIDLDL